MVGHSLHIMELFAFRLLKELDMHKTIVKHQDHRWLDCFPKASTSLESLNFACLRGEVDAFALERLVARSPNLKRLRLNCSVPIDVLSRILHCRPKLEDLGTGSSVRGNTLGAYVTLSTAVGNCSSLKSLSGFWDAKSLFVQGFFPVYKNLTCLNLNSFTLIQRDLINIIRQCRKLNVLWVRFLFTSAPPLPPSLSSGQNTQGSLLALFL